MAQGTASDDGMVEGKSGHKYNIPNMKKAGKPELSEGSSVKKVIGVISGKGGVGKSLVTSLLASKTNREGLRTAILDSDVTGPSIPRAFGVSTRASGTEDGKIIPEETAGGIEIMSLNLLTENETDPVIWRGPVISGVVKQFWTDVLWGELDVMLVDMPPGTGDVALTVFQSLPLDGVIIVSTPQELVGMIVEKAVNMAVKMDVPVLGIVENMSYLTCPDCGKRIDLFGESHIDEIAGKYGIECKAIMPMDSRVTKAVDDGAIERFEQDWLDPIFDGVIV